MIELIIIISFLVGLSVGIGLTALLYQLAVKKEEIKK